jgi:hypothetical protein
MENMEGGKMRRGDLVTHRLTKKDMIVVSKSYKREKVSCKYQDGLEWKEGLFYKWELRKKNGKKDE